MIRYLIIIIYILRIDLFAPESITNEDSIKLHDFESNFITLEEKKNFNKEYKRLIRYLDYYSSKHDRPTSNVFIQNMNLNELFQLQRLIYISYYYFPAEFYNYQMNSLEKYENGITPFMSGPIVANTLDRIADEKSYIDQCLISCPYLLILQIKEIKDDTLFNLETGKNYKRKYLKGSIIKNIKSLEKSYPDSNYISFGGPSGSSILHWGHPYNSELPENFTINYNIAVNLNVNNIYLVFLRFQGWIFQKKDIFKPNVPIGTANAMNQTHGMFELKNDKLIDPYNFFRMGIEPDFNDILEYLNEKIENIKNEK